MPTLWWPSTPTRWLSDRRSHRRRRGRLAEAQADVERLRAKLAAESRNAQQDDEQTGRQVTAEDGKAAARARFAKDADAGTDAAQDSAAAGRKAARARFGERS